jgi:hypothetical protein
MIMVFLPTGKRCANTQVFNDKSREAARAEALGYFHSDSILYFRGVGNAAKLLS